MRILPHSALEAKLWTKLYLCFSLILAIGAPGQIGQDKQFNPTAASQGTRPELKAPADYFRRAHDLTDIRMPGAPPFHMKVVFHAYPPIDLNAAESRAGVDGSAPVPGHPFVIGGDGTYEETWVSPEKWRREVRFGSYRAVEVRAEGRRKFQASSDYEPNRVVMLLGSLFNPIPRSVLEPELVGHPIKWKLEHLTAGPLSWVRISHTAVFGQSDFSTSLTSYAFLPAGVLVRASYDGVTTSWQDDTAFGDRLVAGRIRVSAMDHVLLDARATIEPPVRLDPMAFHLAGGPASAGLTLLVPALGIQQDPRPVHEYAPIFPPELGAPPGTGIRVEVTIDRGGLPREVEMIDAVPLPAATSGIPGWLRAEAAIVLKSALQTRYRPAEIDNDPCEVSRIFAVLEGAS